MPTTAQLRGVSLVALTVQNSQAVLAAEDSSSTIWLQKASIYTITASIVFFSFVFAAQLAFALYRRRRTLGMQQFGPMEIIFIMCCQTLIIPAIFAILQNFTDVPELGSQVLTVTAIFLPLSSMWAAAQVEHSQQPRNSKTPSGIIKKLNGSRGFLGSFMSRAKKPANDMESGQSTGRMPSTATTASSTTASTPAATEKGKHGRVYSGSATSEFRVNHSPMSMDRNEKVKSLLMEDNEKEKDDGELRIYTGRSFDVTEEPAAKRY